MVEHATCPEEVLCAQENNVLYSYGWNFIWISIRSIFPNRSFKANVSLLNFSGWSVKTDINVLSWSCWDSVHFLDLDICFLWQVREVFSCTLSMYSQPFITLLFLESNNASVNMVMLSKRSLKLSLLCFPTLRKWSSFSWASYNSSSTLSTYF